MSTLTVTKDRPKIWTVTFDSPPGNLVNPEMILELQKVLTDLESGREVRAVIFDSANTNVFLGPYDLSRAAETLNDPGPTGMPTWLDLTARLTRLPVVSIAKLRGVPAASAVRWSTGCEPADGVRPRVDRQARPGAAARRAQARRVPRTFKDTASGSRRDRPQLDACLDHLRPGDTGGRRRYNSHRSGQPARSARAPRHVAGSAGGSVRLFSPNTPKPRQAYEEGILPRREAAARLAALLRQGGSRRGGDGRCTLPE